jgi:hypothetical protein
MNEENGNQIETLYMRYGIANGRVTPGLYILVRPAKTLKGRATRAIWSATNQVSRLLERLHLRSLGHALGFAVTTRFLPYYDYSSDGGKHWRPETLCMRAMRRKWADEVTSRPQGTP